MLKLIDLMLELASEFGDMFIFKDGSSNGQNKN